MLPEEGLPSPPEPPPRRCESCLREMPFERVYCTACGHLMGMPVTAAELRRSRDSLQKAVREEIGRIKGLVVFYLLILTSHLGIGLAIGRESSMYFASSAAMIACAGAGAVVERRRIGPLLSKSGFGWKGFGAILLAAPLTFLFAEVLSGALHRIFHLPEVRYSTPLLEDGYGWAWVVALIAVEPGIFEELGFRGFILGRLEGLIKPRDALLASSAMFAIIHLDLAMFPFLFLMGVYLGWLRQRSGSLYPGMLAHFLHNLLAVAAEARGFTLS